MTLLGRQVHGRHVVVHLAIGAVTESVTLISYHGSPLEIGGYVYTIMVSLVVYSDRLAVVQGQLSWQIKVKIDLQEL